MRGISDWMAWSALVGLLKRCSAPWGRVVQGEGSGCIWGLLPAAVAVGALGTCSQLAAWRCWGTQRFVLNLVVECEVLWLEFCTAKYRNMLGFGYSWGASVFMVQLILLMTLMHQGVAWPINFRTNTNKTLQPETWPFLSGVMCSLSCCCLGWHNLDLQESSLACTDFEWWRAPGTCHLCSFCWPSDWGSAPSSSCDYVECSRNEPCLESPPLSAICFLRSWLSSCILFYIN